MSLYAQYAALLDGVLDELVAEGALPAELERSNVTVEPPRDPSHGDLATNAAMVLAKARRDQPARAGRGDQAEAGSAAAGDVGRDRGARASSISAYARRVARRASHHPREGDEYGLSTVGENERVNVEYVSANPTGPLHMGHCRGAVVGDSLARLLEAAGFRVTKEYYVNDAGAQVDTLARSAHLRYREALGQDIGEIPRGLLPRRLSEAGRGALAAEYGDRYAAAPESEWLPLFRDAAIKAMLDLIRHDLGLLGIHHDMFSSEAELQQSGAVERGDGGAARQGPGL